MRVPKEVLDIPGIRFIEPEAGLPDPVWKVEIPSTTWPLAPVASVLSQFRFAPAPSGVLVPSWPNLYHYQQAGVQWLTERQGGLLSFSLGLGKTRTSAVAARVLTARTGDPTLIVGLKYLRETWRQELEKVFGTDGYEFRALEGVTPTILRRPDKPLFLFCHYDIVHAWWSQISALRPRVVILDEAHLIRNPKTRRGKAAALAVSGSAVRVALTGTPILNRPREAFSLLEIVTGKYSWGSQGSFRMRYVGAYTGPHGLVDGEPSNVEELRARLDTCVLRKTPEDVGLELPPVTRELVYVEPDPKLAQQYATWLDGHDPRELIEAVLNGRGSSRTFETLGTLRKLASDMKKVTLEEMTTDLGEDAVVFVWRRESADRLALGKGLRWRVHGGLQHDNRNEIVKSFQAHGGLLSATYDALSTGVTLDRARVVIMGDLGYVPADMLQAEGRVTGGLRRVGKHCISRWLVARGTLDELMIRLIGLKGNVIDRVFSDHSAQQLAQFLGYNEKSASFEKIISWARLV